MSRTATSVQASVIVPTYNRSQLLGATLSALAKQTVRKDYFEVIVSDDGSQDDTLDVVSSFRDKLRLEYCYQSDHGYRPGSARNNGIRLASGDVCILLDSGVLPGSNFVAEHLHHHLLAQDEVAVVGYVYGFDQDNANGDILKERIDCTDIDSTIRQFQTERQYLDIREDCYQRYNDNIGNLPAPWAFFWTCNVSVRRAALTEVGGFDANYDLNWGVEDHDLGYRLCQRNVRYVLNRQAVAIHYPHDKQVEVKFEQEAINKAYFGRKFDSPAVNLFMESTFNNLNDKLLAFPVQNRPVQSLRQ